MKKYNFNAGPSILPQEVIKQTAEAVLDFQGEGLSVLEISHRAKYFQPVMDEAEALMKELLNVPEGYRVLFLGGGASLQFCMVPFNMLEKKAAYLNTLLSKSTSLWMSSSRISPRPEQRGQLPSGWLKLNDSA